MSNVYTNVKQRIGTLDFYVTILRVQLLGDFCHKVRLDFGLFFDHKIYKPLKYLLKIAFINAA